MERVARARPREGATEASTLLRPPPRTSIWMSEGMGEGKRKREGETVEGDGWMDGWKSEEMRKREGETVEEEGWMDK